MVPVEPRPWQFHGSLIHNCGCYGGFDPERRHCIAAKYAKTTDHRLRTSDRRLLTTVFRSMPFAFCLAMQRSAETSLLPRGFENGSFDFRLAPRGPSLRFLEFLAAPECSLLSLKSLFAATKLFSAPPVPFLAARKWFCASPRADFSAPTRISSPQTILGRPQTVFRSPSGVFGVPIEKKGCRKRKGAAPQ